MKPRMVIIASKGKPAKSTELDPAKRLRNSALTAAETRAQADQQRAREKLEWYLGLGTELVTK